ncbi:hypothetical protein FRC01_013507, partial [Tulasnella sp. 417]
MADVEKGHDQPTLTTPDIARRSDEYTNEKKSEDAKLDTLSMHSAEKQEGFVKTKQVQESSEDSQPRNPLYPRLRPFILAGLALLILGWWISATVLSATRHRWIVQTFWAWFFILVIAFRFIPNRVITRPVAAIWVPLVEKPWLALSYKIRMAIGVLALLGLVFGSGYGFPLHDGSTYVDRTISIIGLFVFQAGFYLFSYDRKAVPWPTVIVGLMLQQIIAIFVLKTSAGFSIFSWVAYLAKDFLEQAYKGSAFFFSDEIVSKHYFFVNTLGAIIFFIAFVQMMYYLGVMQWLIKKFAWFFFKTMNVSGAEAVVAAASPWIGQGESACLVRPYVDLMTDSEIHLTMTSGFSTIAGS